MVAFLKRRIRLIIIALVVVGIGFFLFQNNVATKSKKEEKALVKRGTLEEKLTISGLADADEKVTLRFQTSGRLSWVGVHEGDVVKKHQLIAALDQREVKKTLEKYLNEYKQDRNAFDQSQDTYKNQIITDSIKRALENSQVSLNNSVLDVELNSLSIEFANLFSPIAGVVTRVSSPFPGVNITPSQAEFEIINPETIFFSATADQTEVTQLKKDLEGELTLDSYPDKTFAGTIQAISYAPKEGETGTVYEVKFGFIPDGNWEQYRLGMSGDVTFTTKRKTDTLYLPLRFVKDTDGKKYVTVHTKDGKIEKKFVTTDLETDTNIEIVNGLSEGETVYD